MPAEIEKSRPLTAAEFSRAWFRYELTASDPQPGFEIFGEWYCGDSRCQVREVRVRAVWEDGDRPGKPKMRCPACGREMEFRGHVKTAMYIPPNSRPSQAAAAGPDQRPALVRLRDEQAA